ncbi:MAG: ElyC/SanA/YdcF family protein [bacterium]
MFILKKIIARFLFPVSLSIEFSLLGLFFLWFTSKQRVGKILASIGLGLILLLSYSAISDPLVKPLESTYKPYSPGSLHEDIDSPKGGSKDRSQKGSPIKFVVVLGSGNTSDPKLPLTSQLDGESLVRLIEGIRIYRGHKGSKLILSGGIVFDPVPNAEIMARVAREIGVHKNDIIIESQSRDTQDEARLIKPIVKNDRFILVTSASHMRRAMAMFKKQGMNPVPAPTGHMAKDEHGLNPCAFFPGAGSLYKAEKGFYEYLGIAWAKLRGQVQD